MGVLAWGEEGMTGGGAAVDEEASGSDVMCLLGKGEEPEDILRSRLW